MPNILDFCGQENARGRGQQQKRHESVSVFAFYTEVIFSSAKFAGQTSPKTMITLS